LYYIRIKSTFKEYNIDITHISDTIEDSKEWFDTVLYDIYNNTTNELQKKFIKYILDDIKYEIKPIGYGGKNGYIAIDFIQEDILSKHKENVLKVIINKIKSLKNIVGED
jgi:CRISPR/Cas system CSM-associated protein Csm3 (group 7 of RAMP superfamily)